MKRLAQLILANLLLFSAVPVIAQDKPASYRTRAPYKQQLAYTQEDTSVELAFGREIAAHILGRYVYRREPPLQHYVNLVGQTIVRQINRPELEFHFAVIDSDEINAYSTPGGYVFISTAALRLMDNEAELAGVIAHELGHINEHHIVRELNLRATEAGTMSSLAAIIGGSSDAASVAFSQTVNKAVEILFQDGYSRRHEIEADRNAVLYCAMSGYDPRGLQTFLTKVSSVKGKVAIGKTYPLYDQRLDLLKEQIVTENLTEIRFFGGEERLKAATEGL